MSDATVESATPAPDVAAGDLNGTDAVNATGTKIPATPEGMAVAYGSLVIMALIPIFFGAFRYESACFLKVLGHAYIKRLLADL